MDISPEMRKLAVQYVNNDKFSVVSPEKFVEMIKQGFGGLFRVRGLGEAAENIRELGGLIFHGVPLLSSVRAGGVFPDYIRILSCITYVIHDANSKIDGSITYVIAN